MNRYVELWGWLREAFGDRTFTIDEFRAVFPSPDTGKVVHDLTRLNLTSRVETGVYRAAAPRELQRSVVLENMSKEKLLDKLPYPFAYTWDDAVRIWTEGYYWTGFTAGFKPVHIEVNRSDSKDWEEFFRENDAWYAFEDDRKTLFGLVFILHPVPRVRVETMMGAPVIPLARVLEFCRERIGDYGPALEYLVKKYKAK